MRLWEVGSPALATSALLQDEDWRQVFKGGSAETEGGAGISKADQAGCRGEGDVGQSEVGEGASTGGQTLSTPWTNQSEEEKPTPKPFLQKMPRHSFLPQFLFTIQHTHANHLHLPSTAFLTVPSSFLHPAAAWYLAPVGFVRGLSLKLSMRLRIAEACNDPHRKRRKKSYLAMRMIRIADADGKKSVWTTLAVTPGAQLCCPRLHPDAAWSLPASWNPKLWFSLVQPIFVA